MLYLALTPRYTTSRARPVALLSDTIIKKANLALGKAYGIWRSYIYNMVETPHMVFDTHGVTPTVIL